MKSLMATPVLGEPIAAEWRAWGPYLSERQWGTVREDYSESGTAWDYFPHDQARSRTYYWYLDATPTHSYLRGLYKYPQRAFPYADLLAENRRRGREQPEYELIDTGVFGEDRYFDVEVEYAKVAPSDLLIRITATNRGPDPAPLHLLPTLWFRNTWSWGDDNRRPELRVGPPANGARAGTKARGGLLLQANHHELGDYWLVCQVTPELLFTENESNSQRLWNAPNRTPYVKDGIGTAVVEGQSEAVNPAGFGTKGAAHYQFQIAPGATETVLLRLSSERHAAPFSDAERIFADRIAEADAYYAALAE